MLKKILINPYVIGGIIVFLIMLFVGVFGLGFSWGESLLGSAVLAAVGTIIVAWQREVWF